MIVLSCYQKTQYLAPRDRTVESDRYVAPSLSALKQDGVEKRQSNQKARETLYKDARRCWSVGPAYLSRMLRSLWRHRIALSIIYAI